MATLDITLNWSEHDELPSLAAEPQSAARVIAHGRALGESHRLAGTSDVRPRALLSRLKRSADALDDAYEGLAPSVDTARLASEDWLRDNYYVVRDQIREIGVDLPTRYYLELPRLASGPYEGYPRVYQLARELVAPTDGRLDAETLTQFVDAYQESVSLRIGEVWAIGSMLRLALVERLHELATPVVAARRDRVKARELSTRLARAIKEPSHARARLARVELPEGALSPAFAIELLQWLRDQPPAVATVWSWLAERLDAEGGAEETGRRESQREAGAQLSISNVITSMRLLSALDWPEFFERVNRVERVLRRDPAGAYPQMDFATRDRYRRSVEELAKGSGRDEIAIAERACALAATAVASDPGRDRTHHVGYYLISRGRFGIESETGYRPKIGQRLARFVFRHPALGYLGSIGLLTALPVVSLMIYATRNGARWPLTLLAALLVIVPVSELALLLVNRFVSFQIPPRPVPKMDFRKGIPAESRTLVVVPTLTGSPERVAEIFEQLEVRALGNIDQNLYFAVLADFPDASAESLPGDAAVLGAAQARVEALNARYHTDRFFYFHRVRRWNPVERKWMGWERKRGKLEQFNRLLRGETSTDFAVQLGELSALAGVRYVITLDSDTQLPPGAAVRMVGAMAHPLNRPRFDPVLRRVREGYGVLQPRVDVNLRSANRTMFARTMAGHVGLDPYTTAASDVYQDLFHEGSFVGKGIYDVDAFNAALSGRVRENALLSHDLFEGFFVRAGLASDIHLVDDFPTHYLAWASRLHRWVRGDWQLVGWLLPTVTDADGRHRNPLPMLARWKILDNLRRSLLSPALVALLVLGWTVLPGSAWTWTLLALMVLAYPAYLRLGESLGQRVRGVSLRHHLQRERTDLLLNGRQALLTTVFLLDQARLMVDAIGRTLWRLVISRQRLLQWESASDAAQRIRSDARYVWTRLVGSTIASVALAVLVSVLHPERLAGALPILVCWGLAPAVAYQTGLPRRRQGERLADRDRSRLRQLARLTWRFFDQLATADQHWLVPDNIQDDRADPIASRTSPTNVGLQLLSTLSAYDLGYLTAGGLLERLEKTLGTLLTLPRYRGHFYNWYDTKTLTPLHPLYVSTVDSGNLVGCLVTLREALTDVVAHDSIVDARFLHGLDDQLGLFAEALEWKPGRPRTRHPHLGRLVREITLARQRLVTVPRAVAGWLWLLEDLTDRIGSLDSLLREIEESAHPDSPAAAPEARAWLTECAALLRARRRDLTAVSAHWTQQPADADPSTVLPSWRQLTAASATAPGQDLIETAARLDQTIAALIADMNFQFLYSAERHLFSIGFNVSEMRLDASHYDLLASEARLASFLAIAMGQVPHEHWFTLGRAQVEAANGRALLSWSASVFEYLMPLLVMRVYPNTLLEETCQVVIDRQIEYARGFGVAWGISESAYNLRDHDGNYQYRAFGVPGLGLKRGLGDDLVIAPYASLLATSLRPRAVAANLDAIERDCPKGRYGYRDAVDYTGARLPADARFAVVDTYMAHHQGMSLVAITNAVTGGVMQRRFHREPRIQAVDLLLHERIPSLVPLRDVPVEEVSDIRTARSMHAPAVRRYSTPHTAAPRSHLLSNGRYSVLLTNAGSGYSAYGGVMLTRWREDATLDNRGAYCYVRDLEDGATWSTTYQPTAVDGEEYEAIFAPDRATFRRRDGTIELHTEIAVSTEDDVELRRVSITNNGREVRELELTSYAEVVLAPQGADVAHPAFGNLFVETESVPDRDALICRRRPRGDETERFLVHVIASRGQAALGTAEFETDRLRFIGRLADLRRPAALGTRAPLSNEAGASLDPIVSLRQRVRVAPGVTARVSFVTGYAETRAAALALVEKYDDRNAVSRGLALAGSHSQVELRHLNLAAEDANDILRLASRLRFADRRLRLVDDIARNRQPLSGLWKHGISGDLPILLVRAEDDSAIPLIRQALTAREYCHLKGFAFDLVILNEHSEGYRKDFYDQLVALVESSAAAAWLDKPAGVFIRRADMMSPEDLILLRAAARAVLDGSRGDLSSQLEVPARPEAAVTIGSATDLARSTRSRGPAPPRSATPPVDGLQGFNGWGGFLPDAREYVIRVDPQRPTPAPWVNVIATAQAGLLATEAGPRTVWDGNSQWNRLTPWSNDAVSDPPTCGVYLRDETSGRLWSPTPLPCGLSTATTVHHGLGYTRYEQANEDWRTSFTVFAAPDAAATIWHLTVTNRSRAARECTVTGFAEWTLGDVREKTAAHIVSRLDADTAVLLATNPVRETGGDRVAFFDVSEKDRRACADRGLFLGRNGRYDNPAGLSAPLLPQRVGAGFDPCAALQVRLSCAAGASCDVVFVLGEAEDATAAVSTARSLCTPAAARAALDAIRTGWRDTTGSLRVSTPDPSFDLLMNDWLLYQTLSCRVWGRTAFYQSSGAYGFRDQLQDVLALCLSRPDLARAQLLRAAAHQFVEGDVQHWWHEPTDHGVRTRFSDDRLWLVYAAFEYARVTADTRVFDEVAPFISGRALGPGDEEVFDRAVASGQQASLYEHCARAFDRSLELGVHGLPLIGTGDWNDGMNRVGRDGKGESVWLAWFHLAVLPELAAMAAARGDAARARLYGDHIARLRENVEQAWDGAWYRRAYFDDGTPLGSASSPEGRIDAIAQAWAVMAGPPMGLHAREAMASAYQWLVRPDDGLVLLLTPPFDHMVPSPGYIQGYTPGIRENGGQYTHASLWLAGAFAALGDGDRAFELLHMINPATHSRDEATARQYRVEPYVLAGDVYSTAPHVGRGGWTWYTGAAGWMYRIGVEALLGLKVEGATLRIAPSIPARWPGFTATLTRPGGMRLLIDVQNPDGVMHGVREVWLDDTRIDGDLVRLPSEGEHRVRVVMGAEPQAPTPAPAAVH